MFAEHNLINLIRLNFHRISPEAFRSSQPTMGQLQRYVRKYGIKTILNLKGRAPDSAYYALEVERCRALGVRLVDVKIHSRTTPDAAKIRTAKELFDSIEYPMWMHCKAGADRTGIYATLYQHFRLGMPIERTDQLRLWPYGHIKQSKAGKFDFYLQHYLDHKRENPDTDLLQWSETVADRATIDNAFHERGWASFINDRVLRRQ